MAVLPNFCSIPPHQLCPHPGSCLPSRHLPASVPFRVPSVPSLGAGNALVFFVHASRRSAFPTRLRSDTSKEPSNISPSSSRPLPSSQNEPTLLLIANAFCSWCMYFVLWCITGTCLHAYLSQELQLRGQCW